MVVALVTNVKYESSLPKKRRVQKSRELLPANPPQHVN